MKKYFLDVLSADGHPQGRKKVKASEKWLDGSYLSGSQWASNQAVATGQGSQERQAQADNRDNSNSINSRTGSCRYASWESVFVCNFVEYCCEIIYSNFEIIYNTTGGGARELLHLSGTVSSSSSISKNVY